MAKIYINGFEVTPLTLNDIDAMAKNTTTQSEVETNTLAAVANVLQTENETHEQD